MRTKLTSIENTLLLLLEKDLIHVTDASRAGEVDYELNDNLCERTIIIDGIPFKPELYFTAYRNEELAVFIRLNVKTSMLDELVREYVVILQDGVWGLMFHKDQTIGLNEPRSEYDHKNIPTTILEFEEPRMQTLEIEGDPEINRIINQVADIVNKIHNSALS